MNDNGVERGSDSGESDDADPEGAGVGDGVAAAAASNAADRDLLEARGGGNDEEDDSDDHGEESELESDADDDDEEEEDEEEMEVLMNGATPLLTALLNDAPLSTIRKIVKRFPDSIRERREVDNEIVLPIHVAAERHPKNVVRFLTRKWKGGLREKTKKFGMLRGLHF